MLFKQEEEVLETGLRASNSRILVVGNSRQCLGYENVLRRHNFRNVETCADAFEALQMMEHEPAVVLIMDAEMPEVDGFEMASNIRDIERSENRYTHIIAISEKQHCDVELAWQANVDVILTREAVPFRLIPQVMAGERSCLQMNRLLSDNATLAEKCSSMEAGQLLDPLTGLGNKRQAIKGMEDTIRQIEARGGALAVLLIKINDLNELVAEHNTDVAEEVIVSVGNKIRRLVRPLDIVTYFDKGVFAVVMQHDSLDHCKESSYERIRDGLVLKNYQTRAGFVQTKIAIGACGAGAETGPPKATCIVDEAMKNLGDAGQLKVTVLNPF